jgi:hypothetical protein
MITLTARHRLRPYVRAWLKHRDWRAAAKLWREAASIPWTGENVPT